MKKSTEFDIKGMLGLLGTFVVILLILSGLAFEFFIFSDSFLGSDVFNRKRFNQAMNTIAELKCPMMQYETYGPPIAIKCYLISIKGQNEPIQILGVNYSENFTDIDIFNSTVISIEGIPLEIVEEVRCPHIILERKNFTIGRYISKENKIECLGGNFVTRCKGEEKLPCYLEDIYEKSQKFTLEEMEI